MRYLDLREEFTFCLLLQIVKFDAGSTLYRRTSIKCRIGPIAKMGSTWITHYMKLKEFNATNLENILVLSSSNDQSATTVDVRDLTPPIITNFRGVMKGRKIMRAVKNLLKVCVMTVFSTTFHPYYLVFSYDKRVQGPHIYGRTASRAIYKYLSNLASSCFFFLLFCF